VPRRTTSLRRKPAPAARQRARIRDVSTAVVHAQRWRERVGPLKPRPELTPEFEGASLVLPIAPGG
jgi:hypothetical protein